jgi:hypothetical protein
MTTPVNEVRISTGLTGKLVGIDALSVSCFNSVCDTYSANPKSVCFRCYGRNYESFRPAVRKRYEINLSILERELTDEEVDGIARQIKPRWNETRNRPNPFRLNSFGEIQNFHHVQNYFRIARARPDVQFALWTKRTEAFWFAGIPDNLVLVYSAPYVDVIPATPGFFHHTFVVFSKPESIPSYMVVCRGKTCADCQSCYSRSTSHFIGEVLK